MAGRDVQKQARSANVGRRLLVGMGAGAGVFLAAAAMATGSTVTAAPAKADFDALIDPIIQPILASLTDSLTAFDPSAAAELTSWSDSFLSSLNSLDLALPAASDPSSAVAAAAEPASSGGTYDIPLNVAEDTEPYVNASIDGGSSVPLLVDTGSSGLVIPWEDLGSNDFSALENLFQLGFPQTFGFSGYSGGVDYIYGVYPSIPVDYGDGVLTTNGPVDVELFSWPTSFSAPANFETFLQDNDVSGILGVGGDTGGPTTSPFESMGGVLVDIPDKELVISATNPLTSYAELSGSPTVNGLTETVTNGSTQIGTGTVSNDIDSGGVYGNIPSSIAGSSSLQGDTISVYNGSQLLYSYLVGTDSSGTSEAPGVISGSSIDSGVEPFLTHPIYLDYANDNLYFDNLSQ
jgi:hypothetical protein